MARMFIEAECRIIDMLAIIVRLFLFAFFYPTLKLKFQFAQIVQNASQKGNIGQLAIVIVIYGLFKQFSGNISHSKTVQSQWL